MRWSLAIQGDLREMLRRENRDAAAAVTGAMKEAAEGLKQELRGQVRAAGLGNGLANSWRSRAYPNSGLDAAAFVWSNAPTIIRAHDEGATIRSQSGLWLAIPTENAPRRGTNGKRISPTTWPQARFGPLRFVPRPGRTALLVADDLRASYSRQTGQLRGFRRAAERSRAPRVSVVMFVLVPQVRLKKKLDVERAAARWLDRLPQLILEHYPPEQI